MNITTLLGSPRKKGNTARVLSLFEDLMREYNHTVNRVNIVDYKIEGCLGCGACRKIPDAPGCVRRDDAVTIFERMIASDVVVYATPLYCWGFSAQMKALLDRHYCLVTGYDTPQYTSLLAGTRTGLLVTCADQIEQNADLIQVIFDRENAYCQCEGVGKYIVPYCTTPDALGDKATKTAENMVRDLLERS
jgi:multimeric flavodoxin WrbA